MAAWLPRAPPQLSRHCSPLPASSAAALLVARAEHSSTRIVAGSAATTPDSRGSRALVEDVRTWTIRYPSHTGAERLAHVVLPAWYGPGNNPPLPVVISPHGRGATGLSNAAFFDRLPAIGRFAVISPDGMGQRLKNFSYGAPGQIDDLARMPGFAAEALPWLRIDSSRIYALGSSMGGQETLLLVARHPRLLAGAAALDSVTDLSRRYEQLPQLPCGQSCVERWGKPYGAVLQSTLAREVGGSPQAARDEYAARSGLSQARTIARSRCAAADLVEYGGSNRVGSRAPVAGSLRRAAPARPLRAREPRTSAAGRTRRRCARASCCRSR